MSKAILLLHGFATDKTDFSSIMDELNSYYDFVLCPNLPGHEEHGLKNFNQKDTIEFVENAINTLESQYDVIDVMGYSMGGALASYLAGKHKVHKLILLAPAHTFINIKLPLKRTKELIEYVYAKSNNENSEIIEEHKNILKEDNDALDMAKKYILPNYNIKSVRQFISVINYCKKNMREIDADTLVILGDIDQFVPEKPSNILSKHCKKMTILKFKNVSHMMLRSKKAKLIIKNIMDFIKCED